MKVKIKKCEYMPEYATEGSAGMDIRASKKAVIYKNESVLVSTGLFMEIPEGYELQIRPRSGLAVRHGITVLNSPGTIDSDYRGEIKVLLHKTAGMIYAVKKGDKIAQGILAPIVKAEFETVTELENTKRGTGCFGSTGG